MFAPDCYCYRCPFGLTYPSCGVACAEYVDYQLTHEGDVAAMIVEPVVGTNGVLVPVPEYLPRIRAITKAHDVLLIADEVMTGGAGRVVVRGRPLGGRPGHPDDGEGGHGRVRPSRGHRNDRRPSRGLPDGYFPHGHTYEAHPLTLAPAVAAIAEYPPARPARQVDRGRGVPAGPVARDSPGRHPSVGEVRGLGLFAAVELVRNRTTRAPFNTPDDKLAGRPLVVEKVAQAMLADGVYVMPWVSHLVVAPPLVVTRDELDRGVDALDRALGLADAEVDV